MKQTIGTIVALFFLEENEFLKKNFWFSIFFLKKLKIFGNKKLNKIFEFEFYFRK